MCRPAADDRLPAAPLAAWIQREIDRANLRDDITRLINGKREGAIAHLANRLGVDPGMVSRWRDGTDHDRNPTDSQPRETVEDALDRYGVFIWEVFPDLPELAADMADRWCGWCAETVTVGDDLLCPWCETPTRRERWAIEERTYA